MGTEKLCAELTFFIRFYTIRAVSWMFDLFSISLDDDTGVVLRDCPRPP